MGKTSWNIFPSCRSFRHGQGWGHARLRWLWLQPLRRLWRLWLWLRWLWLHDESHDAADADDDADAAEAWKIYIKKTFLLNKNRTWQNKRLFCLENLYMFSWCWTWQNLLICCVVCWYWNLRLLPKKMWWFVARTWVLFGPLDHLPSVIVPLAVEDVKVVLPSLTQCAL